MNNGISLIEKSQLTMSSREISEMVNKRHDNVKRTIENLLEQGVIVRPQIEDVQFYDTLGRSRIEKSYIFKGEKGKRDSIIIVAQLCPEFTAKLVDRWQELEKVIKKVAPISTGLAEFRKSRSIMNSTKAAEIICNRFTNLSLESQQVIFAKIVNSSVNEELIPLPKLENKTYSATEVGEKLGISSNMVGRIAKKLDLKTEEYGIFILDKSRSSDKQVESFRYNQKAIDIIAGHLTTKAIA